METTYFDFGYVSVPVTCPFVFVIEPVAEPVGTCGCPSLASDAGTAVLVCFGAFGNEEWTFVFEMPN